MQGWEIAQKLSQFGPVYKALSSVVSIDQIPTHIDYNHFIVVNLSPANSPGNLLKIAALWQILMSFHHEGTHWISISNQGSQNFEIFDSLGIRSSNKKLFKKYLKAEGIEINHYPVQESTTSTCASFVIYYSIFTSPASKTFSENRF